MAQIVRLLSGGGKKTVFLGVSSTGHAALLHCGPAVAAGQKWRLRQGKARSGNEYGPLTDLPDWSYVDGRPAPATKGQQRRAQRQRVLNERILRLMREMDDAKDASIPVPQDHNVPYQNL